MEQTKNPLVIIINILKNLEKEKKITIIQNKTLNRITEKKITEFGKRNLS
jgi:hypothetical protein